MKTRLRILAAAAAAAATATLALPAQAATTTATFTLTAGSLSITAPGASTLGSTATGSATTAAQLGAVAVSDARGALLGSWTANVTSTDFTTGAATADETIAKANANYWSGLATATSGTAVFTPGQASSLLAVPLSESRTAFAAASVVGNNSATWNPTVVVNVPSAAVTGTYSGTITHSIA